MISVINVRNVRPEDILSVIDLAFVTLPERYNPAIFNHFYESFPDGFFIAEHKGKIIGFLIGIKTRPGHARILMLSVDPQQRRHGIGTSLLNKFLQEMKEYLLTQIELEVRTTNKIALNFYKHHGFILQDTLQHFYQNGEDAFQMVRRL